MPTATWLEQPTHHSWLQGHTDALLLFGRRTPVPGGGAAWLDDRGDPLPDRPIYTWITCRTVHVYAIGYLLGIPGCRPIADMALAGLHGPTARLHDGVNGGWYGSVSAGPADATVVDGEKGCYAHAFVMLAAATARQAGLAGADELLQEATTTFLQRFWDDDRGLCVDTWDVGFDRLAPYRGINANMHAVEAMLAVADVTGDTAWLQRAGRIAHFVLASASVRNWRIPEHFDRAWLPLPDYNSDRRDDPFKPYGATIGHGLEWSRLLLHLEAALNATPGVDTGPGTNGDDGHLAAAAALYRRAVDDGWRADGAAGFVYTTDWDGNPVVRDRMHWVTAEAIGAAAALHRRTGDPAYAADYARWWDYASSQVIDHRQGSWHHQLDADHRPMGTVWPGKADLYHAFQATLIPRLPLHPSMAAAVAGGALSD